MNTSAMKLGEKGGPKGSVENTIAQGKGGGEGKVPSNLRKNRKNTEIGLRVTEADP